MPELPEVEYVRRRLSRRIVGSTIARIELISPSGLVHRGVRKETLNAIRGGRVVSVARRGKYLLVETEEEATLICHFGMSGRLLLRPPGQPHDIFCMSFHCGQSLTFNDFRRFGRAWVHSGPLDAEPILSTLGPEALSPQFSESHLLSLASSRSLKTILLDQRVVAGVGNIYACESLFWAGLHPERPASSLQACEAQTLVGSVKKVLRAAIKLGGSTLPDYRGTEGAMGEYHRQFAVFGREGHPCPTCDCKSGICRLRSRDRYTYFCARRQR